MKKLRLLWRILKTTDAHKIMLGFGGFVLVMAFILQIVEPNIETYGDGLWYVFAVFTTTGFGDIVAETALGRVLTMLVGLYGILVVALIPGVVVSYFTEMSKMRANASVAAFLEKLEHLDTLSQDELKAISGAVKHHRYKM